MQRKNFLSNKQDHFSYLLKTSSIQHNSALHFAHATGFNASTYTSLLLRLSEYSDVYAMDLRGHGDTEASAVPSVLSSWQVYADDIASFTDEINKPLVLIGHSMGAIASLTAALETSSNIRSLILIEPVLPTPFMSFLLKVGKLLGLSRHMPIAKSASHRKSFFNSKEDAFNNYKDKGAFKNWTDSQLVNYIDSGFKLTNKGCELNCSPEWESKTFSVASHDNWEKIAKLKIPLTIICGGHNSTIPSASIRALRKLNKDIKIVKMDAASHFLPMEYEDWLVAELKKWL